MREQLFTTHEISTMLQVDPSTASKWIDKGMLLAFRTPGGHRRVRASDLRSFLVTHGMPIPDELGSGVIKLLVVDDEQPTLDAIRRALKAHAEQFNVTTTTSGIEALLLMAETKPNAMLIDLNMPDLDGIEVVRRVREREQFKAVKLLTMTARHSAQAEAAAMAAGALACLHKPVTAAMLLELLGQSQPSAARR